MAANYQQLAFKLLAGCLFACLAPFLGVALLPLLIGAPLAVPALLLAGGGWLSRMAWLFLMEKLTPAQQVRPFATQGTRLRVLPQGHCYANNILVLAPVSYTIACH